MTELDFPFHVEDSSDGPTNIVFTVGTEEMMKFEDNGNVYIRGQLVDDNEEVYKAFKDWLEQSTAKV